MRRREHKVSYLSSEAIFAIPAMKPSKVILSLLVCGSLMLSDVYYESSFKIRGYAQDLFMPLSLLVNAPLGLIVSIPDSLRTRSQLKVSLQQAEEENKKLKVVNQFLEKVSKENEEIPFLLPDFGVFPSIVFHRCFPIVAEATCGNFPAGFRGQPPPLA